MWMAEFSENEPEEQALSQDDKLFIKTMSEQISMKDGHYQLPLPFKCKDPQMPNSRQQALVRLNSIKRKMINDSDFKRDYLSFMQNIIDKGYASICKDQQAR